MEYNVNETKIKILRCLSDGEWWTTPEVTKVCNISLTNASELLRRYRNQGIVSRKRNYDVPKAYRYRITLVGLERLQYLSSADDTDITGVIERAIDRWTKQWLRKMYK